MKGISPVIAIIMLVFITISIASFMFTFFSDVQEKTGEDIRGKVKKEFERIGTDFTIDNIKGDMVYIRNSGKTVIQSSTIAFYINDEFISAQPANTTIGINQVVGFELARNVAENDIVRAVYAEGIEASYLVPTTSTTTTVPPVIAFGGIAESNVQFGSLQRKVVYSNANWYAFHQSGGRIYYNKSSDGITWNEGVSIDTDANNINPSVWLEGSLIYVAWLDGPTDTIEVNTINTASADTLGTKCTVAIGDITPSASTYTVSITVADDGTVYTAYSDTAAGIEFGVFDLTFSTCISTAITTGSGLTAGDRPVLMTIENNLNIIYQDGTLSTSVYNGSSWTASNVTIDSVTDNVYDLTTNGTNVWVLSVSGTTATNLYTYSGSPVKINDIDTDVGSNAVDPSIYCPTADDCKVVYYDASDTDGNITFADCNDASCSSPTINVIDIVGPFGAIGPSIYCPTATDCKVVYLDITDRDLTFADCNDAACSAPTINDIDIDVGVGGKNPSIYCPTADDCKVVYYDGADDDITFVDCNDANCSAPTINDIDIDVGTDARGPSIYCPTADDCKVVYYDATDGDITFVDCNDANCSAPTINDIDTDVGLNAFGPSIYCPTATDCKVVYYDATDGDITFVDCNDANCSAPTINDIDTDVNPSAFFTSIYCPSASDCKVVYFDNADDDITFADCNDASCSSPTINDIDSDTGGNAIGPSIYCPTATDCKVVYFDSVVRDITFVDCNDAACSSPPETLTAPWTGETNLTSVSITYDSANTNLYSHVIKDASDQAYWKSTDAATISWSSETSYGFTAGDLGQISSTLNASGPSQIGVVVRQGSNFEFNRT